MTDENPSPSPGVAAEPVGVTLARIRRAKKLTGKALGQLAGMSQAKISRIENGITAVEPDDVRALARALQVSAELEHQLVEAVDQAHDRMTDWRPTQTDVADRQRDVARLENATREFRVFQPAVVVGLLQTSEYARAVFSRFQIELDSSDIAESSATVADAVSARVRRHEVLTEADRHFHFLMAESVLSNRLCRPADMVAQIERLREVAGQDNVTLRLIPADNEWAIPPYHGFELMDDRCVLVDLFNTSLMSRGRSDVGLYRQVFDALEEQGTTDIDPMLDRYLDHYLDLLRR